MRYAVIIILLGFCLFRADAQDQTAKEEVQVSEEWPNDAKRRAAAC